MDKLMSAPECLRVIDGLYEAALLPSEWPTALQGLAAACGGVGVAVSRGQIPEPALASPSLKETTAEYAAIWWRHDSRTPRLPSGLRGRPLTDADLLEPEERARDPYYQEFLRRHGLGSFAAVGLAPQPGLRLTMSLEGPRPFGSRSIEMLSLLRPHVERALATTIRLGLTEGIARDLLCASEHVTCGMIFLSADGQVTLVNPAAERMLGDGLAVSGTALVAAQPSVQSDLDRLVAGILPGSAPTGEVVLVRRPSGKRPLLVQGVAIEPRRQPSLERLGVTSGGGLLIVNDLAAENPPDVSRHLERMGLTRAQARVAELVGRGLSLKEVAAETGVVEGTARTQLKASFARLGIGRQSELAALVTRLGSLGATP
jgi:DNA-binding CsgD family transcriptional regulator